VPPHLRYEALVNVSRDARGFDWLEIRDVNISKQRHSVAACDDQDQVTSGLLLCLICDGVQAGDQTPAGEGDDGTGAGAAAAVQTREHSMSVSMGIGSDIVEDHHEAIAGRCMYEVYVCVRV